MNSSQTKIYRAGQLMADGVSILNCTSGCLVRPHCF